MCFFQHTACLALVQFSSLLDTITSVNFVVQLQTSFIGCYYIQLAIHASAFLLVYGSRKMVVFVTISTTAGYWWYANVKPIEERENPQSSSADHKISQWMAYRWCMVQLATSFPSRHILTLVCVTNENTIIVLASCPLSVRIGNLMDNVHNINILKI